MIHQLEQQRTQQHIKIFIASLTILISAFLINLVINHKIAHNISDVGQYGDYFVITQMIFILGTILPLGYDLAVDRFIPVYLTKNKHNAYTIFLKTFINVVFKTTFVVFMLTIFYKFTCQKFKFIFIENEMVYYNIMYLNSAFCISLLYFTVRLIRAHAHFYIAIILYQLLQPISQLLLLFYFNNSLDGAFHSYVTSWFVAILLTIIIFKIIIKSPRIRLLRLFDINNMILYKKGRHTTNKIATNLLLSSSSDYMYSIIVIIINTLLPDQKAAGYAAAIGYFNLMFFIIIRAISSIYKPMLMQMFYSNQAQCKNLIRTYSNMCLVLASTTFIIILIFGKYLLLKIFGADYIDGYIYLCLFTFGFVLVEGFAIHKITLEMFNSKEAKRIVLLTNLLSIGLAIIFSFHSLGAVAISFIASRIIFTILILMRLNNVKQKFFKDLGN